jgi:predicted metal-dependent peptidase
MSFDLNKHIYRLLQDEPFFAALSRQIDKRMTRTVPTAGVGINRHSGHFELYYNPEYFETISDKQKAGVLKHEFYHLVFEHVTDRLPSDGMSVLWNIATDLAINGFIRSDLPPGCCVPGEGDFATFPEGLTAESYFEMLKRNNPQQKKGDKGDGKGGEPQEGDGQFDSHDSWGEQDAQTKEIAKERLKEIAKKASDECDKGSSWGSVSHQIRERIKENLIGKTLDWRKLLRYFVRTSQVSSKKSSIKTINRRYPYIHAGKKSDRQAKIAISIDQSGSVSDAMLSAFFQELEVLAKIADFVVIPFDDEVFESEIFTWKKGEKRKHNRVFRGGTNFDAPTDYVNKHGFDGHIILTDMYAPKPKASKCQRAWLTDKAGATNPYFKTKERVLVLR